MNLRHSLRAFTGAIWAEFKKHEPDFLDRFDRWLMLNHPLVWRTQISRIIPLALVLIVIVSGLSWCLPHGATELASSDSFQLYAAIGTWVAVLFAFAATLSPLMYPAGELSVKRQVQLFSLSVVTGSSLMLSAFLFPLLVSFQIARAAPESAFHDDIAFHRQHHFWACGQFSIEEVRDQRAAIEPSLARFGLHSDGETSNSYMSVQNCPRGHLVLVMWNTGQKPHGISPYEPVSVENSSAASALLIGRIQAIEYSSQLWYERRGPYWDQYVVGAVFYPIIAIFLAGSVVALSYPRYAWQRLLRPIQRQQRPRPRLLAQHAGRSRRVLLRDPFAWATRLHSWGALSGFLLPSLLAFYAALRWSTASPFKQSFLARLTQAFEAIDVSWYLVCLALGTLISFGRSFRAPFDITRDLVHGSYGERGRIKRAARKVLLVDLARIMAIPCVMVALGAVTPATSLTTDDLWVGVAVFFVSFLAVALLATAWQVLKATLGWRRASVLTFLSLACGFVSELVFQSMSRSTFAGGDEEVRLVFWLALLIAWSIAGITLARTKTGSVVNTSRRHVASLLFAAMAIVPVAPTIVVFNLEQEVIPVFLLHFVGTALLLLFAFLYVLPNALSVLIQAKAEPASD